MAHYSIESSLPGPAFSSPTFKPTPTLAPLVFEISRIHRPMGDHDPNSSGSVLLSHLRVGHADVAGSSSSSLSLSSGGGSGGCSNFHNQHHHHRLPHNQHDQYSTARHSRINEFSDQHHHLSLAHQQPLNEIEIPSTGKDDRLAFQLVPMNKEYIIHLRSCYMHEKISKNMTEVNFNQPIK